MKWMNTEPDDQTIHDVIRVSCEFLDGASLDEVEFIVGRVEASLLPLRQDLGVRDMFSRMSAGRAIFELFLKDPDKSTSEFSKLKERVRKSLPDLAGIRFRLGGEGDPGSQEEEVDTVNLTLFGDSADRLDAWGTRVLQIMQQIKGVRHAFRGAVVPSRDVVLGPDQSPLGISAQRLTQTLQFTLRGSRVAPVRLGDRELQAWVLLHPDDREGMSDLDSLVVANQSQGLVPLGSVSRRSYQESLGEIRRESKQRIYPITLELTSEHPQNMHEIVKDVLGTLSWPAGMSWSFGQRFSDEEADNTQMIQSSFLAIFLVFLVMASLFEALAGPFLILFTIPFALVGVVWYVTIFQIPMGVMTSIGAFLLLGIVVNNGIILVDTINRNRREGQSIERAILTAGRDRFRPIWMTALTTIFGMLPMALGRAAVGKGLYSPLAHAIIGGLSFCTVWTLLAIPYLYWMFDTFTRAAILAWRILILSEPFDVISRK